MDAIPAVAAANVPPTDSELAAICLRVLGAIIWRSGWLRLVAAALIVAAGTWASSGTLAPYAATLARPLVWEPCGYLLNIDHLQFKAVFEMLAGAPRGQWEGSVILRRVLHPLVAYPFMTWLGFGAGGVVANVLMTAAAIAAFWRAWRARLGHEPPLPALALLATQPGIYYWSGLPYSYAAIVPITLLGMVVLWRLESVEGAWGALGCGLALGVLYTGYDLMPYFGPASMLVLVWRQRWRQALVCGAVQLVPTALVVALLSRLANVPALNSNTQAYFNIVRAYLAPGDLAAWGRLLAEVPGVLLTNLAYSTFLVLPLLCLLLWLWTRALRLRGVGLDLPSSAFLIAIVGLFLFNNLAPPYAGWQLRGTWIPRLYQPVFVVGIVWSATALERLRANLAQRRWRVDGLFALAVAAQSLIVFGPGAGEPRPAGLVYERFYRHDALGSYSANVATFGARALGRCASPEHRSASATP